MLSRFGQESVPAWATGAAVAVCLLIAGTIAWRTLFVSPLDAGPAKQVRPGMYDLRQEVQKMRERETAAPAPPGQVAPDN